MFLQAKACAPPMAQGKQRLSQVSAA